MVRKVELVNLFNKRLNNILLPQQKFDVYIKKICIFQLFIEDISRFYRENPLKFKSKNVS